jgi:hypothetical protein
VGNNGKLRGRPGRDRFTFSDPNGQNCGAANYEVIDDKNGGGQILIKNIDVKGFITNPEALKDKVLQDIAAAYPEHDINWNTKDTQEQSILKTALEQIRLERDSAVQNELHEAIAGLLGQGDVKVTRRCLNSLRIRRRRILSGPGTG